MDVAPLQVNLSRRDGDLAAENQQYEMCGDRAQGTSWAQS